MNNLAMLGLVMASANGCSNSSSSDNGDDCSNLLLFSEGDSVMVIGSNETVKSFFISRDDKNRKFWCVNSLDIKDKCLSDCIEEIVSKFGATSIKVFPSHTYYNKIDQYLVVITCPKV